MAEQTATTKGNTITTLLVGALSYTAFGTAAALLWSLAVPAVPAVGLLPFLALWWVWMLFFLPSAALYISISQAMKTPVLDKE